MIREVQFLANVLIQTRCFFVLFSRITYYNWAEVFLFFFYNDADFTHETKHSKKYARFVTGTKLLRGVLRFYERRWEPVWKAFASVSRRLCTYITNSRCFHFGGCLPRRSLNYAALAGTTLAGGYALEWACFPCQAAFISRRKLCFLSRLLRAWVRLLFRNYGVTLSELDDALRCPGQRMRAQRL